MLEKERIDHDGLFKELLTNFFEEFMILFFPKAWEEIDFKHTVFLSQELIRDIFKGEKKVVDLLIETKLKDEDGFWIYVKFLDTKRLSFFAQQPFMDCSTSQVDCQSEKSL